MTDQKSNEGAEDKSETRSYVEISWVEWVGQPAFTSFDPDRPIEVQLLSSLPVLIYKLTNSRNREDRQYVDFHWRLSMLPYCLAATYKAYVSFASEARKLVDKHGDTLPKGGLRLSANETYDLNFAIDSFLESGRRTQNALVTYLSAATRQSMPESFSKLMQQLERNPARLPDALTKELMEYWIACGKTLKFYRDISQHHTLIAENTTVFRDRNGTIALQTLLPNHTDDLKLSELSWGAPPIHAQGFLKYQLLELIATSHFVTKILCNALPGESKVVSGVHPRRPMQIGAPIDGHKPPTDSEVAADVLSILKKVDAEPLPSISL